MSLSLDLTDLNYPQIVKTIFIVDKDKQYTFDVDQNIAFKNLKLVLISAANLSHFNLHIFHEGIEYTSKENETLQSLFPNLETIIFTLSLRSPSQSVDDSDELVKVNLCQKSYCTEHEAKFTYFYCYTCKKSICSVCFISEAHKNHTIKEKYDYLQSSKHLIERMCSNLNEGFKCLDDEYIIQFKDNIRNKLFGSLVKMLKNIEEKLIFLFDEFVEKEKNNLHNVKQNITSFKHVCMEGIDELKDKISFEDMMLDESIFLSFDKKFNDVNKEKEKIKNDIDRYLLFKSELKIIGNAIDKIYNELYTYLDKYLNNDIYSKISKEINSNEILPIKSKTIMNQLFSNIKCNTKKYCAKKKVNKINITNNDENINNNFNNFSMDIENNQSTPIKKKNIDQSNATSTDEKSLESQKLNNIPAKYVCKPVEDSNNILVYNVQKQQVEKKAVDLNELAIPFLPASCAWYNYNNYLYITGGKINSKYSSLFMRYNPETNIIERLNDLPYKKESHSICTDDSDNMYLVGGLNNTILKYNLVKGKWTILKNELIKMRRNPICFLYNSFLYIFFGIGENNEFLNSYERVDIFNNKIEIFNTGHYHMVNGTVVIYESYVYFFGGRTETGITNKTIKFNPATNRVMNTNVNLIEPASFHQNNLLKIGDNNYGNFSLEDNSFIKFNFY